jgi:MFS family permease
MVVSIGYLGFLIGPIVIGAVSTAVGLPWALAIPAVLGVFVAASAGAMRVPAPAATPSDHVRPAGHPDGSVSR